jgi:hypothetical protein
MCSPSSSCLVAGAWREVRKPAAPKSSVLVISRELGTQPQQISGDSAAVGVNHRRQSQAKGDRWTDRKIRAQSPAAAALMAGNDEFHAHDGGEGGPSDP